MFARWMTVLVWVMASAAMGQMTWFVDDDAPAGGNGMSWASPFKHLQDALMAAQPGDRIHVGAGTYYPDRNAANPTGTGDRKATFQLKPRVTLLGSFAGFGAVNPNERVAPGTFPKTSILSGDLMQNDGPNFANRGDNSIHIVNGTGGVIQGTQATGLDGFQISGGNANGAVVTQQRGGGYYMENGDVVIFGCEFKDNQASGGGGAGYISGGRFRGALCRFNLNQTQSNGGAIFLENAAAHVILEDNSRCENNRAPAGGALFAGPASRLEVTGSTLASNTATFSGGAVQGVGNANILLTNTVIGTNTAGQQGGGIWSLNSTMTINGGKIDSNRALFGGGVFVSMGGLSVDNAMICNNEANTGGGAVLQNTNATFNNTTFLANTALQTGGGGVFAEIGPPQNNMTCNFNACEFDGNRSDGQFGLGGGAMCLSTGFGPTPVTFNANLIDCLLRNNRSERFGAGVFGSSFLPGHRLNLKLETSYFFDNSARVSGGAIYAEGGDEPTGGRTTLTIDECEFARNECDADGGAVLCFRTNPTTIRGSTFRDCAAGNQGGAVMLYSDQGARTYTGEGNVFEGNSAAVRGGAVCIVSERDALWNLTFDSDRYVGNFAVEGGGGLQGIMQGSWRMQDCDLVDNGSVQSGAGAIQLSTNSPDTSFEADRVFIAGSWGHLAVADLDYTGPEGPGSATATFDSCVVAGGEVTDGAAIVTSGFDLSLVNSAVFGNSSTAGDAAGIIINGGGDHQVINSTIAGNQAPVGNGGGVRIIDTSLTVANSILSHNVNTSGSSQEAQISALGTSSITLNHSLVQNLTGSLGGTGNIGGDPLFVDILGPDLMPWTGDEDVAIDAMSPCIDAGDNTAVPAGITVDLGGHPRYVDDPMMPNTGVPGGTGGADIIDMGAFEFQAPAGCYADCDPSTGVGVLDIFDFLCFGNRFATGEPYACDCDLTTGAGVCDIFDFLCFGNAFSAGCP